MYVDYETLERAFHALRCTADPMLKVWLTLKHMGFTEATASSPRVEEHLRG